MDILIAMCIGMIVGNKLFPRRYKKTTENLQVLCTILLIFSMGVKLGKRENFLQEISILGWNSFIFFFIPSLFSLIIVFFLTRYFIEKKENKEKK